jgi:aspartate aminotransferase
VQSHSTSHPASITQVAGEAALGNSDVEVAAMRAEFERRRDAIVALVAELPGVTCVRPSGAFYVFPNISGLFGRKLGDRVLSSGQDVTEALLETARVAVVPGEAFGSADHVRISFACALETIRTGMGRIQQALA